MFFMLKYANIKLLRLCSFSSAVDCMYDVKP